MRIGPVALFELCEMLWCEWPILLRDVRDVASSIVYPYSFRLAPLGKKDDVGLRAWTVWDKCPVRQSQHSMQAAILGENFEYFTSLIRKEAIVRYNYCRAASRLQDCHDVLDEVELLIAGADSEIIPRRSLIRAPRSKRRIRHHHIEMLAGRNRVD